MMFLLAQHTERRRVAVPVFHCLRQMQGACNPSMMISCVNNDARHEYVVDDDDDDDDDDEEEEEEEEEEEAKVVNLDDKTHKLKHK